MHLKPDCQALLYDIDNLAVFNLVSVENKGLVCIYVSFYHLEAGANIAPYLSINFWYILRKVFG